MLSNHSFNALLKTLEEPPEHVKFLLATTDPQKLPVTILSRCLQFNLKNMSPERIVGHLQFVLGKEVIPFEEQALWLLARSADGSMRDALSLTDQAISFGGGKVVEMDVAAMLGTIDHVLIQNIMSALVSSDGQAILQAVAKFAEHAPDFNAALADLLTLLHRIAIAQALPEALDNSYGDRTQILEFATQLAPQDVQLFYQTALVGRRDLPLASDPRSGFEMTLLRMLAFKPQGVVDVPRHALAKSASSEAGAQEDLASEKKPLTPTNDAAEAASNRHAAPESAAQQRTVQATSEPAHAQPHGDGDGDSDGERQAASMPPEKPSSPPSATEPADTASSVSDIREQEQASVESHSSPQGHAPSLASQANESGGCEQHPADHSSQVNTPPVTDVPPAERASKIDIDGILGNGAPARTETGAVAQSGQDVRASLKEQVKAIVGKEGITASTKKREDGPSKAKPAVNPAQRVNFADLTAQNWIAVYLQLDIRGIMQSTVSNSVLVGMEGNHLHFLLDEDKASLFDPSHAHRLGGALSDYFDQPLKVDIQLSQIPPELETPARYEERIKAEKRSNAIEFLKNHEVVRALEREFDGAFIEESVKF